jgi:hypothetical protein
MPFGLFTTSRPASPTKGPGHIYKLTLDGRIVGRFGESRRNEKQFN